MRSTSESLHGQGLYIVHLAQRLEALERSQPLQAVPCRLFARRLQSALAGYPDAMAAQLGGCMPSVLHALAQRHFDEHGAFRGAAGSRARQAACRLFRKLGCTIGR